MIKKIKVLIIRIIFIAIIGLGIFFAYQYIQYKNAEIDSLNKKIQAEADNELQKELLNKELKKVENFVVTVNNQTQLVLLRTNGVLTLQHDKTPSNNKWTEWLFDSNIEVYVNYISAFTIDTNKFNIVISEDAKITISYDIDDIKLSLIDIKDFSASASKSIFGENYTPNQVAAFNKIARDKIENYTNSEKNITQAKENLENTLQKLANSLEIQNIEFITR